MASQFEVPAGTMTAALIELFEKGVRYATVIDIGCADGHFFLAHHNLGILAGAVPLHIDANAIYEDSLKAIKGAVGGDYFIGAATEHDGEVEMTSGAHPYWNSLRPEGDVYWQKMNSLSGQKVKVPALSLDALVAQRGLKPPFLLKIDIQGGEVGALRGAQETLRNTHAVLCEADMDDFDDIYSVLHGAGLGLFDLTEIHRLKDRTLGWLYPVFVNRALNITSNRKFWEAKDNAAIIQAQNERRKTILQHNAAVLAKLKATAV